MLLAQEVLQAYTMISISMMVVFTSLSGGGARTNISSQTRQRQTHCFVSMVCACVLLLLVQAYEDNSKMRTFPDARTFEPVLTHSRAA